MQCGAMQCSAIFQRLGAIEYKQVLDFLQYQSDTAREVHGPYHKYFMYIMKQYTKKLVDMKKLSYSFHCTLNAHCLFYLWEEHEREGNRIVENMCMVWPCINEMSQRYCRCLI